jgi:hypothetical protein
MFSPAKSSPSQASENSLALSPGGTESDFDMDLFDDECSTYQCERLDCVIEPPPPHIQQSISKQQVQNALAMVCGIHDDRNLYFPFDRHNARLSFVAQMHLYPFGHLGKGFCGICNIFMGWQTVKYYCNGTACCANHIRYTYQTGSPHNKRWYLPALIGLGNPFFKRITDVIYLDEHDCPIIRRIYMVKNQMWVPLDSLEDGIDV